MFVHTLVKTTRNDALGWCAPVELGDDTPEYVSYVVPLDRNNGIADDYTCEVVKIVNEGRVVLSHKMVKSGHDSLMLNLSNDFTLWFSVRPINKQEQRLPYIGRLTHEDFDHMFTEIEPDNLSDVDMLCNEKGLFIIGCDPFKHYAGLPQQEIR